MSMPPPGAESDDPHLPPTPPSAPPPPAFGGQPPAPAFGTQAPPGYVSYNQAGGYVGMAPLANTVGLRKWLSGLFITVTVLTAVSTWAQFARVGVVDDFIAGEASIFDIDDADQFVAAGFFAQLAAIVATAIVLCIWTLRTVRNAEALVGGGLKPKLAAGGWFIPVGNLWVSFAKLRQAAQPLAGKTSNISWWQGLWIVAAVTGNFSLRQRPFEQTTIEEVRDALNSIASLLLVSVVLLAVTSFFAIRALRDMENAIETRRQRDRGPA